MKKIIFLSLILFMIPASFLFCNELPVANTSSSTESLKKVDFTSSWTSDKNSLFDLTERYATSKKYKAFSVVGFVGLGNFVAIYALYLFIGFIGTPIIGLALEAEGSTWFPLLGLIGTSWIPFIGPFVGAGMMNIMAGNKSMVPLEFKRKPYNFYGPLIAYCILTGIMEIPFFIMMIVGFVGRQAAKNDKVSMIFETDNKGNKIIGLSFAF